jgi:NitT/TauT family transport system substrate-binding protein
MPIVQSRRRFLTNATVAWGKAFAAEPPPETTTLRIKEFPVTCTAPTYVAEELLYAEGFTDVRVLKFPSETQLFPPEDLLAGEVDITLSFAPADITRIEAGAPVAILVGSHSGCVEVFARERVRSVSDLKGKTVAIPIWEGDDHIFISMFAAYVGLNPQKDIDWAV